MRTYTASMTLESTSNRRSRLKVKCIGRTVDHAAIDALRRTWKLFPGLRDATVGRLRWHKEC